MLVYTVTKPGGAKDYEFDAFAQLLEDIGTDLSNVPRTPEPETNRRWLYTWTKKEEAERFVRELRVRTRDTTWNVYPFEAKSEVRGPVAPLDIQTIHDADGITYYLPPVSSERIIKAYPHTRLSPRQFFSHSAQQDFERQHGQSWLNQLCKLLTGLTRDQISILGGCRVLLPDGKIWREELPKVSDSENEFDNLQRLHRGLETA